MVYPTIRLSTSLSSTFGITSIMVVITSRKENSSTRLVRSRQPFAECAQCKESHRCTLLYHEAIADNKIPSMGDHVSILDSFNYTSIWLRHKLKMPSIENTQVFTTTLLFFPLTLVEWLDISYLWIGRAWALIWITVRISVAICIWCIRYQV